ncbi:unnamed protein product [Paramecium primaurelia]|uniref:Uncharacterized protein n=1 Tax=Paramecium primaurelia TaxID=5886 RepID=A0A8S1KSJ2_PARPR|nr:unnamed protein product [Paramecium primaurelia]
MILNALIFKFTTLKIFFVQEFIQEDREINHQKSGISTKISTDMIFYVYGEKDLLLQIKQLFHFLLMSHLKLKDQPQF